MNDYLPVDMNIYFKVMEGLGKQIELRDERIKKLETLLKAIKNDLEERNLSVVGAEGDAIAEINEVLAGSS